MAVIRPAALNPAESVPTNAAIPLDTGSEVARATPEQIVDAAIPLASENEAVEGSDNTKRVTPLRVKQAMDANMATTAALASTDPGKGASLSKLTDGANVQQAIAVAATGYAFLATETAYVEGSTLRTADGHIYTVAPAAAVDHDLETAGGVKLYVALQNGKLSGRAMGLVGTGLVDESARFLNALRRAGARGVDLFLDPGVFRVPIDGTEDLTNLYVGIVGSGSANTVIDGVAGSNLSRLRMTASGVKLKLQGVKFENFHRPIYAAGATFIVEDVSLFDVEFTGGGAGVSLLTLIRKAWVNRYSAHDLTADDNPLIGLYGLLLGGDFDDALPMGNYCIQNFFAENLDGSAQADNIPCNGIALRGHRAVVDKFEIKNVRAAETSTDCEGFYGKLAFSRVTNGYLYNAGQSEGAFVLKGATSGVGQGFPAQRNVVKNVVVECDDGLTTRPFYFITDSVDSEDCHASGATASFAAVVPISEGQRFSFRRCTFKDSEAIAMFTILGGNVLIEDCEHTNPLTAANKARPIHFAFIPSYATQDIDLTLRRCLLDVPSTYDATGLGDGIQIAIPSGKTINLTVEDTTFNIDHTTASNKRGIVYTGAGTVGDVKVKGFKTSGLESYNLVRLLGAGASCDIAEWGSNAVLALTSNTTLNESYIGKVLTSVGAGATRSHTLPKALPGMKLTFASDASFGMNFTAASGDSIVGATSLAVSSMVVAQVMGANTWLVG